MACPLPVLILSISGAVVSLTLFSSFGPLTRRRRPAILASTASTGALSHVPPSFHYERDWYTEIVPFTFLNLEKCRLCRYRSRTGRSDSTDTDAILSFLKSPSGLIPFCRSIRTVGCNARVILLTGEATLLKFTKSERVIIKNCGVETVSFGRVQCLWWENDLLLRFAVLYDYLYPRREIFSRILLLRTSDVMFQADPFTSDIRSDSISFVAEDVTLNGSRYEKFDFQKLPIKWDELKDQELLTDSVLVGGPNPLLVFLDMYIFYYSMAFADSERTSELAYFMYCFYQFVRRSKRLSHQILTNTSGIVGLGYYNYDGIAYEVGELKVLKTRQFASIVMHYPRNNKFLHSYYDACPRDRMKAGDYMPQVAEGYMNGTLDRFGHVKVRDAAEEDED
jgi:hypothetical protein